MIALSLLFFVRLLTYLLVCDPPLSTAVMAVQVYRDKNM